MAQTIDPGRGATGTTTALPAPAPGPAADGRPAESALLPAEAAAPALPEGPGRPADPCVMVIFGGAGDLTKRKLLPSLYNLASNGLLAAEFAVVGVARAPLT